MNLRIPFLAAALCSIGATLSGCWFLIPCCANVGHIYEVTVPSHDGRFESWFSCRARFPEYVDYGTDPAKIRIYVPGRASYWSDVRVPAIRKLEAKGVDLQAAVDSVWSWEAEVELTLRDGPDGAVGLELVDRHDAHMHGRGLSAADANSLLGHAAEFPYLRFEARLVDARALAACADHPGCRPATGVVEFDLTRKQKKLRKMARTCQGPALSLAGESEG